MLWIGNIHLHSCRKSSEVVKGIFQRKQTIVVRQGENRNAFDEVEWHGSNPVGRSVQSGRFRGSEILACAPQANFANKMLSAADGTSRQVGTTTHTNAQDGMHTIDAINTIPQKLTQEMTVDEQSQSLPTLGQEQGRPDEATRRTQARARAIKDAEDRRRCTIQTQQNVLLPKGVPIKFSLWCGRLIRVVAKTATTSANPSHAS